MRLKQSSRSAFSNDSGCVGGASLPLRYHSSMPQKCPDLTFRLRSFTRRATNGSCSVGPMAPREHLPLVARLVNDLNLNVRGGLLPGGDVFERLGQVELLQRV